MAITKENTLVILGAPDHEMLLIEGYCDMIGIRTVYVMSPDGMTRCNPAQAYDSHLVDLARARADFDVHNIVCIECTKPSWVDSAISFDHHRPGDCGYNGDAYRAFDHSSLGQFIQWLTDQKFVSVVDCPVKWSPDKAGLHKVGCRFYVVSSLGPWAYETKEYEVSVGACDHNLTAAYCGLTLGLTPAAVQRQRARAAQFRPIPVSIQQYNRDFRLACEKIHSAEKLQVGDSRVYDMRPYGVVPELPDAASYRAIAYMADVTDRDGRRKCVLGGAATQATVIAFIHQFGPSIGLTDCYGVPARGFAGGYYK